ncbi:hypothetical protein [Hydrogenophaga sp. SL48]|uniref:hypothetical protein n=1 Tax=Hydrogenophaga sp. SL48 TaxID=2806347 RepID=UPI003FA5A632
MAASASGSASNNASSTEPHSSCRVITRPSHTSSTLSVGNSSQSSMGAKFMPSSRRSPARPGAPAR